MMGGKELILAAELYSTPDHLSTIHDRQLNRLLQTYMFPQYVRQNGYLDIYTDDRIDNTPCSFRRSSLQYLSEAIE
jgi:hypothetical protein